MTRRDDCLKQRQRFRPDIPGTHFRKLVPFVCLMALLCFSLACEFGTTISVDGKNPPTFTVRGSGRITLLTVSEVARENQSVPDVEQDHDRNRVVWWITPKTDQSMWKVAPITYGVLPSDFSQKEPTEGGIPPVLIEGSVYDVWVVATG